MNRLYPWGKGTYTVSLGKEKPSENYSESPIVENGEIILAFGMLIMSVFLFLMRRR